MKHIINSYSDSKEMRNIILNNYGESAIANDWKMLGNDIRIAMSNYGKKYGR